MTIDTSTISAAQRHLDHALPPGRVLVDAAFEKCRRVWNGAVDHHPAIIVRPETPDEIRVAVLAAREYNLALSVRGGGHDWAGRSIRHGGLVIDLSAQRRVVVDPQQRLATVQGGATARDVAEEARQYRLAAALGTTGGVGVAGLTLGGGYGPFNGRFGLSLDNLISAEVILPDGRLVTAAHDRERELFWAIRGGGGNFGVVTSMRLLLHPVDNVLAGIITFPWVQAARVWSRLGEILAECPDELTVQSGILPGEDGVPSVFLYPVWSGRIDQGENVIDQLKLIGSPLMSNSGATTPAAMLSQFDAQVVDGRHYGIRTRSVRRYSPEVIRALAEGGDSQSSRLSAVYIHHFHGAATRVDTDATAFGLREPHFMIEIVAAWEHADDWARQWAWADDMSQGLAAAAVPGGYPNLLGPGDHDQIAHAYGANADRLRAAKAHFDPDGIFSATPLPGS
jgi:hypothetical protein